MSAILATEQSHGSDLHSTALEQRFPSVPLSLLAERESWRKELNRPVYHIHKWWATRLGSVFRAITLGALLGSKRDIWAEFYKHHDFRGKTVLDPFMGSGTTLGEALKLGCNVVGCDINPISTFLVQQALAPMSEQKLKIAFNYLEDKVAHEIRRYYTTNDRVSGKPLQVLYFFWVKVVVDPNGNELPLFDRLVFSQDAYPKRKPLAQVVCVHCWSIFEDRYDSTSTRCRNCGKHLNPQNGPAHGQYVYSPDGHRYKIRELLPGDHPPKHRLYAILALDEQGRKIYLKPESEDLALYAEASRRLVDESLPLPQAFVRPGHNTNQARSYGYMRWREFFNDRQLLCLGLLLKAIEEIECQSTREHFLCLFSSTLEFNNLFCSFKGHGTGAVRHMFSHHILKPERTPLENSVWGGGRTSGTFASLFESRLLRAKRYLLEPFELQVDSSADQKTHRLIASPAIAAQFVTTWNELQRSKSPSALVLNGDSARLPLPDQCVDAVITDPPYFDFVHYSELSDFFFAWLSPVLKRTYPHFARQDSSDPGEVQQKDPREFARQLARVFSECKRVLKEEGILAFSFHHSRPEGWAAIAEALIFSGLQVVAAHPVHAEQRGTSPKNAASAPISLDMILVCKRGVETLRGPGEVLPVCAGNDLAEMLEEAGYRLSSNDRFVISAGLMMKAVVGEKASFELAVERFSTLLGQSSLVRSEVADPSVETKRRASHA